jgi:hypothetical protein
MRSRISLLLVAGVIAAAFAHDASAIPAFARKYQFSCSTCHAPFPRLKPYGEDFAARGFRMERPESEPPRASWDTGDPLLLLNRDLPLALRMDGFASLRDESDGGNSMETPWAFKILSGGPLSPHLSYYLYFIVERGETEGLEDAYLQYNGLFGTKADLIFGQFQVSDPLFKRELRLVRSDYDIYKVRVGDVQTNLTYDRGAMMSVTGPAGVDFVATIVNGDGIPKGSFDRDNYKNFALRAAREFGALRLGGFVYAGKEKGDNGRTNETLYFGPDLAVAVRDRWQLNVQYLERRDDDPFYRGAGGPDFETRGGFAELLYFPRGHDGHFSLTLLYSRVDSDDAAAESENVSLGFGYLLSRNVRFIAEVGRDERGDRNTASIGLVTAF